MTARLDLIGIVVADMARSLAFYRRGMRYATVLDPDDNSIDLFATLPSGS